MPLYPYNAAKAGLNGKVLVSFTINTQGEVINPHVVRSNNPWFERPALDAILTWKFKPALKNGRPVNVEVNQLVEFDSEHVHGGDLWSVPVRNPNPDAGQVSSLRLGLATLAGKLDAALVALADQPLIGAGDINDLIGAYKKRPPGTEVVQPSVNGLPGNPVVFSQSVREAILQGQADVGCRQWQAAHPQQVFHWETSNTRYRTDVDTPEDIEALAQRTGHRLVWPAHLAQTA